jgi:hypothetical protein
LGSELNGTHSEVLAEELRAVSGRQRKRGIWAAGAPLSAWLTDFRRVDVPYIFVDTSLKEGHDEIPYIYANSSPAEITDLSPSLSTGSMYSYEPISAANADLFVFLLGSYNKCGDYTQLLEAIAPHMHVLCLPYDNTLAVAQLCFLNDTCYYEMRVNQFNGSFTGVEHNNIEERLVDALQFLRQVTQATVQLGGRTSRRTNPSGVPSVWVDIRKVLELQL